jgi:ribA/ribD-fused uncharacterized protein
VGIKNWRNNKDKVAQDVLTAKFTQHQDLMALLKSTGNGILVEASPIDSGWGVGLASTNPAILNQSTWRGSNLLGKALMHVRDQSA